MDERREVLLSRKKHMREEIRLLFYDVEHLNHLHPNEEPIDIDPDGMLQQLAYDLDIEIARDEEK